MEEGSLGAHLSARGQQCGQVSALGGSGPHCAPLGLETGLEKLQGISLEEEASVALLCSLRLCFPRLASGPWVWPGTALSSVAPVLPNAEAPEPCASMPRGEKGEAEAGSRLTAFCPRAFLPTRWRQTPTAHRQSMNALMASLVSRHSELNAIFVFSPDPWQVSPAACSSPVSPASTGSGFTLSVACGTLQVTAVRRGFWASACS